MADSYFHVQLTAILDSLLKTAAVDICALADSVFASLQREIERRTSENEELRRQLQSFAVDHSVASGAEAAPLKTKERNSRAAEDRSRKAHDCRKKASNMGSETGGLRSGQRLQNQSTATAGVKEEVTEMYVTPSVENKVEDVISDEVPGTEISAQLSDVRHELKTETEKIESAFRGSQPDWNDCGITDYEEDGESSPALEGQQDNQDTHYAPYTNYKEEGEDDEAEKEQPPGDACLPQGPDLQCTFIQIDGTVTTSVNQRQSGSPIACGICGKVVLSERRLRVHIKTHSDLRPYTCPQCGKGFTRKATLNFHQNIHRGVKPYSCSICPKSFADPSALRRHKAIHKMAR